MSEQDETWTGSPEQVQRVMATLDEMRPALSRPPGRPWRPSVTTEGAGA